VVVGYAEDTHLNVQRFLCEVPILDTMAEGDRALMADAAVMRWYADGEYIVRQGEVGDKFCLLMDGHALVTQVSPISIVLQRVGRVSVASRCTRPRMSRLSRWAAVAPQTPSSLPLG
jgi:hypothetical protein